MVNFTNDDLTDMHFCYGLADWSTLMASLEGMMENLEVCLHNSYFQVKNRFDAQHEGFSMGIYLSLMVVKTTLSSLKNMRLSPHIISPIVIDTWTIIIWHKGGNNLKEFLDHQVTMETEKELTLAFLDGSVNKMNDSNRTSVYRKSTCIPDSASISNILLVQKLGLFRLCTIEPWPFAVIMRILIRRSRT